MRPFSTSAIAWITSCSGSEIDIEVRISARSPSTTATNASTSSASSMAAVSSSSQPLARITSSVAMARPGSPVQTVHISISRARTPGAMIRGTVESGAMPASTGRRVRSVNRNPVHTVATAPNSIAEPITASARLPAARFIGISTPAATSQGASVAADCRPIICSVDRRSASVGGRPSRRKRSDGRRIATALPQTTTAPTTSSAAAVAMLPTVRTSRPPSASTIAMTSPAVSR